MSDNSNNNKIKYLKIFVYGIVFPSIISFGFYYTMTTIIKNNKDIFKESLKEMLKESFNNTINKNIKEIFSS
jgi:hypothetical protein